MDQKQSNSVKAGPRDFDFVRSGFRLSLDGFLNEKVATQRSKNDQIAE